MSLDCEGSQSIRREPMQAPGKPANCTKKDPKSKLKPGLSLGKGTALAAAPLCHSFTRVLTIIHTKSGPNVEIQQGCVP